MAMWKIKNAVVKIEADNVFVEVEAVNSGTYDTEEVVQVYVKNLDSIHAVKNPFLVGFTRISLKCGEHSKIQISVSKKAFEIVDDNGNRREDGSHFRFYVGCSQPDTRSVVLTGKCPMVLEYER